MSDIYFEDELTQKAFKEQKRLDDKRLRMDKYRESVKLAKEFCQEDREKDTENEIEYRMWDIAYAFVQDCLDCLVGGCGFDAYALYHRKKPNGDTKLFIVVCLEKHGIKGRYVLIPIEKEMRSKDIKEKIAKLATSIEQEHIYKLLGAEDYE